MTVFEIVVLISAICGLFMIAGGIWLVGKGAITLGAIPQAEALTIEWKKQFRIHTQAPGIAFFLVGLFFLFFSLKYSRPPDVVPIEFRGQVTNVSSPITVLASPSKWPIPTTSNGVVDGKIYPDLSKLVIVATAPGYVPFTTIVSMQDKGKRLAEFGTLELKKAPVEQVSAQSKNINNVNFTVPPMESNTPSFGEPQ